MFIKTEIETESHPQKPQKSSQSSLIYFPNRQQELTPEQTYRNTAIALVQQHKWDEAIAQYQQAIQVNPKFAEAYWEMGNLLAQLQQWDQAISCYRKVIQFHPNTGQVYHNLGDVLLKLQQWEAAVEAYQQALQLNPQFSWSYNNLGDALRELKQWETAAEAYRKAIKLNPSFPWAYYNLGDMLSYQQRWHEAVVAYTQASQIQPDLPRISEKLADAISNRSQTEVKQAIARYQQALKLDPDNPQLYYKALKLEPRNSQLYYRLGNALLKHNQRDQALIFYKIALLYQPEFPEVIRQLDKLRQKKPKVEGFPDDLILPALRGEGNDYTFIEEKVQEFIATAQPYTLPVSLIIPTYNRKKILAKTLAALTHQTYPKHLIEVIIADDGSTDGVEEVVRKYEQHLELIHVRQQDRGYRLSAVRNLGIRTSSHDQLIILDCDMLPHPHFVEAYMKYLHVSDQVALIGHRRFVCTDDITDDEILDNINVALSLPDIQTGNEMWDASKVEPTVDWRVKIYQETDYLKQERYPFRAFVGAATAYSKKLVQDIGFYDEDFQQWGEEDKEYGYRAYNAGYYFIPVLEAVGLHQEPPGGENENDRKGGHEITTKILEQKCPAGWYRKYKPGVIYAVPKVSIYIPSYNNGQFIQKAIDSVLNQSFTDLEVCIVDDGSTDNTLQILEENYPEHPRVRWQVQANGGIGKASNAAIQMCRGMYIGQLDSDDVLKPNAVEKLVKYLDKYDVGCVYSSCERIDSEGNYLQEEYNWPEFSREKLLMTMIVHHFRMFRRRDWLRTTGFDETLTNAVDYDLFLKLSEVCSFHHLNESLYLRRIHGKNTSVINQKKQDQNNTIVLSRALQRMGLSSEWEVEIPDPEYPRKVSFRRIGNPS